MEPLTAAIEHGPGMHGAAVAVIAMVALMAGLVYAVWAWRSRKRSAKPSELDQGRGA